MDRDKWKKAARAAFPGTLPVMAGYLVLGFGFGLLLQSKGYNFLWAFCMSLFVFAGSMQYVLVDLLATGAGLVATAMMTLMINARHLFYGLSMLVRYRDVGKVKPYLIFGLTDETYSLVCQGEIPAGVDRDSFYFCTTLFDHLYWIIGSTFGGLFGQTVHLNTTGVDFSMTALFLVIFTDQWLHKENRIPCLTGLCISLVCLLVFGASDFLIPSMLGISAALMLMRPMLGKQEVSGND